MAKRTVKDVQWAGKRALVRVDFNLPFQPGTTTISDDTRIRAVLPTVQHLREQGAGLVLCTHLGRPSGKPAPDLELGPVAERLAELIRAPVQYVHDAVGELARTQAEAMDLGDILLLENVRFYPGEEANDPEFARAPGRIGPRLCERRLRRRTPVPRLYGRRGPLPSGGGRPIDGTGDHHAGAGA